MLTKLLTTSLNVRNITILEIYDRVKLIPEEKTPVPIPTPPSGNQKEEKKKP